MITNIKKWLLAGLLVFSFLIFTSCSKDNQATEYIPSYLPSIDATNLPKGNHPMTMFEDDESPSKMYNKEDRWFRLNQILQVIQKGKDSVQISLYSPVGLTGVKIYAKLANYDKRFLIYYFTKIPAFHRSFHQIPLVTAGKKDYLLESGKTVTIDKIDGFSTGAIQFSVESSDPLFAKFKKIKSSELVQFDDSYHLKELGKFLPMNPVLAKEAITMIINYSYALSHPLYHDTFIHYDRYIREQTTKVIENSPVNFPDEDTQATQVNNSPPSSGKYKEVQAVVQAGTPPIWATDWHGNGKDDPATGKYDYLSKADIEKMYGNYIDGRTLYMAMVGGGAALGGGNLASQWESDYVTGHWLGEMSVWTHEYSHHTGFSHSSNLCNSGQNGGQQGMFTEFYKYLIYLNDLPFTNPNILKGWTKTKYLTIKNYKEPIFKINPNNPFLLKYKGEGKWK